LIYLSFPTKGGQETTALQDRKCAVQDARANLNHTSPNGLNVLFAGHVLRH
jgi:hypothetical protein